MKRYKYSKFAPQVRHQVRTKHARTLNRPSAPGRRGGAQAGVSCGSRQSLIPVPEPSAPLAA
eukprot:359832-Chlamydomonas_euryale.AAC.12